MKIGVAGCLGRMGSSLVQELRAGGHEGLELAGGTVLSADLGKTDFFTTADPAELFARADAVIDFTTPEATRQNTWLAAKHKKAYVVGTTGLSAADEQELADAARETRIVYAANMSVGVNILLALVEQAAPRLAAENWDIEIFESHHKRKVDAPSGTALAIGRAAASGRGVDLQKSAVYSREGHTGARNPGTIGFSVARGGDVVGDHRVYFYGEGERIELSHIATDRLLFARGALRAAQWALDQKKPGLYSMRDVLGL
ncbi:MAG: 4-hydroxy-tetrahydrodipicolinate reductase [Alphaproteobacteria bacterium]|nr:4-hydroxy-tetrahydrodipicolinate reductase [Alphaproteobacteria bacterium]